MTEQRRQGVQVLLVEDNKTSQLVMQQVLLGFDAEVTIVENGQEALNAVQQQPFDIVLMDVQMPVMDGYEATKQIRLLFSAAELPVIAMTASTLKEDREKALEVGMNDYLSKPIEVDAIHQVLGKWIEHKEGAARETVQDEEESEARPSQLPGLDVVEGVGRMMGQWGIYFEIIQHFAETNQFFYDELIRNLKEEEVDNVVEMLHRFKGISASISANELSALLAEIEKEMRERGAIGQSQLENLKRAFETVMTSIASARTI